MKKLLSILAAVGLVATSSTAVVACSSAFDAGSLTINGADDLAINYTSSKADQESLLDNYIESKTNWKLNNNQRAQNITTAKTDADKEKATWDVVVPVFIANVKGTKYYSFSAQDLYNKLSPDNTDAHDVDTLTNKLELQVEMIKLGGIQYALGTDDKNGQPTKNISEMVDAQYKKDAADDSDQTYVHVNLNKVRKQWPGIFESKDNQFLVNKSIQKVMNIPDKSIHGLKVEISTAPRAVIDKSQYTFAADTTSFVLNGANLNLLTNANTKLLKDGKPVKQTLTFAATREAYRSVTITLSAGLDKGDYQLVYTPAKGETVTVDISVN